MIELNDELHKAVAAGGGQPLRLVDPATRQAFVLIREDDFQRLNKLAYDASPWTEEEMELLAAEDVESLGWEGMEALWGLPQCSKSVLV
jgi:hypothetical protein